MSRYPGHCYRWKPLVGIPPARYEDRLIAYLDQQDELSSMVESLGRGAIGSIPWNGLGDNEQSYFYNGGWHRMPADEDRSDEQPYQ